MGKVSTSPTEIVELSEGEFAALLTSPIPVAPLPGLRFRFQSASFGPGWYLVERAEGRAPNGELVAGANVRRIRIVRASNASHANKCPSCGNFGTRGPFGPLFDLYECSHDCGERWRILR